MPGPGLRDGVLVEIGVVAALAAAMPAACGAGLSKRRCFRLLLRSVGSLRTRTRDFGEQSLEESGKDPAPLRANRAQGPIETGQLNFAPFDHIDGPHRPRKTASPSTQNLHLTQST